MSLIVQLNLNKGDNQQEKFAFFSFFTVPLNDAVFATFSYVPNLQMTMDGQTESCAHNQTALLVWSLHPVGQEMSQWPNRIFRGVMPSEEFSYQRYKKEIKKKGTSHH